MQSDAAAITGDDYEDSSGLQLVSANVDLKSSDQPKAAADLFTMTPLSG